MLSCQLSRLLPSVTERRVAFGFFLSVFVSAFVCDVTMSAEPALPSMSRDNPFYAESTLPFFAPDFSAIQDSDYQPAFVDGMKQQLAEMQEIRELKLILD